LGGVLSNVGGLVGWNRTGGNISNSYATSAAQTSLLGTAGGLVGTNDGSIMSSYATGATGGLLSISGGLVGSNSAGGSIGQSYFDALTTGQLFGVGSGSSAGVTALTTSVFQNGSLPAGLSSALWTATAGQYPLLNWQASGSSLPPSTTVVITATDSGFGSLIYGNAPTFTYKVTDLLGNVLCTSNCSAYFTGTPLIDTTLSSSSSAGTSAPGYIAQGTLVAQSGYSLQFVNDALSVAARLLTITASNQSKTYGSIATLGTTAFTTSGLANGDTVANVTLASSGSAATSTVAGGPYAITASAALGTGLSNYIIGYAGGLLTVNPAPVTVTALGGNSTYGSSPSNPGLSATGLQNGQSVNVLTGLSNSFGITNMSNAGIYTLGVTGSLSNTNYVVAGTNNGTWTVNPALVNVTALGGSSTYGSSPSNPGLSVTGLQNGQGVNALTGLSSSFGITNMSNAGIYTLGVTGSLSNANYVVAGTNNGTWTVNPALVTVTALGGSSTLGSSPTNPGLSATGLQNGQSVNVLTGLGNSFGITNKSAVGNYTMGVTGSLTNPNYVVASTATGSWAVTPLRGSLTDGTSPSIPGSSVKPPPGGGNPGVLEGLGNSSDSTNTGNRNSIGNDKPAAAGPPIMPRAPAVSPNTTIPQADPPPASVIAPAAIRFADQAPYMAATASPSAKAACPGNNAKGPGDAANDAVSYATGISAERQARPCAATVPQNPAGLIDFALSKLNRSALLKALDRELSEVRNSRSETRAAMVKLLAGTSIALTAGFVGWFLRGGALLSALLSSMPVWRGFDPLMVVLQPRRRDTEFRRPSRVDLMFDNARKLGHHVRDRAE
jgi:hypothetical protein